MKSPSAFLKDHAEVDFSCMDDIELLNRYHHWAVDPPDRPELLTISVGELTDFFNSLLIEGVPFFEKWQGERWARAAFDYIQRQRDTLQASE